MNYGINQKMKLVLIVYPVKNYVDYSINLVSEGKVIEKYNSLCLDSWERTFSKALNLKLGNFRERFRIFNQLIQEYRENDFQVGWVFFGKEENRNIPDKKKASNVFDIKSKDLILSSGISYTDINNFIYPKELKFLSKLKGLTELIVGGFHKSDCVRRFAEAGNRIGIKLSIDTLLTEEFFTQILSTFYYDLDTKLIADGFLDPEMHEDNPEEMKILSLDDRLKKYF